MVGDKEDHFSSITTYGSIHYCNTNSYINCIPFSCVVECFLKTNNNFCMRVGYSYAMRNILYTLLHNILIYA